MVKEMSEDLIKVVVDLPASSSPGSKRAGKFRCIHKGTVFTEKMKNFVGMELAIEGKTMTGPKKKLEARTNSRFPTLPKINI